MNEATRGKSSSKKKKIQSSLARHPTIERSNDHSEWKTGQANQYHTKSWEQAKRNKKDGWIWK